MKVVDAIYENGEVVFPVDTPNAAGPIGVLIIFPDDPVDALDWGVEDDWEAALEVPF